MTYTYTHVSISNTHFALHSTIYDNRIPQNLCLDACYEAISSFDCSDLEEDDLPLCNGSEPIDDGEDSLCRPTNGEVNVCQFENFVVNIDNCGGSGSSSSGRARKLRSLGKSGKSGRKLKHGGRRAQNDDAGDDYYYDDDSSGGSFTVLERVACNSSKSGKGGRRRLPSSGRRLSSGKSNKIE